MSQNVLVCAGGLSRHLLKQAGITLCQYFTHAELIEVPSSPLALRSLVMPADTKRFALEADATDGDVVPLWKEPGHEVAPPILDAGAVYFQSGRLIMGQISRVLTDPFAQVDANASEVKIRAAVGAILPSLKSLPGNWHHCLVAFSGDRLPLIGEVPNIEGIHVFSGFGNPFAILPPLAKRFAAHASGAPDDIIRQLSPTRSSLTAWH